MSHFKLKDFFKYFGYTMKPSMGMQDFVTQARLKCAVDVRPDEMLCYVRFEGSDRNAEIAKYQDLFGTTFEQTDSVLQGYICFRCQFQVRNYNEAMDLVQFLQSGVVDGFIAEGECYAYHGLVLSEREREYHESGLLSQSERIKTFQKVVDHGCLDPILINYLGKLHAEAGDVVKASQYFVKACEVNPYFAEPFSNMGALMWHASARDKGFNLFCEALLRCPFDQNVQDNFIKSGLELGEIEKMSQILDKTREFFPEFDDLLYLKAVLLEKSGRRHDCITLLNELHSKNPDDQLVSQFLSEVQGAT